MPTPYGRGGGRGRGRSDDQDPASDSDGDAHNAKFERDSEFGRGQPGDRGSASDSDGDAQNAKFERDSEFGDGQSDDQGQPDDQGPVSDSDGDAHNAKFERDSEFGDGQSDDQGQPDDQGPVSDSDGDAHNAKFERDSEFGDGQSDDRGSTRDSDTTRSDARAVDHSLLNDWNTFRATPVEPSEAPEGGEQAYAELQEFKREAYYAESADAMVAAERRLFAERARVFLGRVPPTDHKLRFTDGAVGRADPREDAHRLALRSLVTYTIRSYDGVSKLESDPLQPEVEQNTQPITFFLEQPFPEFERRSRNRQDWHDNFLRQVRAVLGTYGPDLTVNVTVRHKMRALVKAIDECLRPAAGTGAPVVYMRCSDAETQTVQLDARWQTKPQGEAAPLPVECHMHIWFTEGAPVLAPNEFFVDAASKQKMVQACEEYGDVFRSFMFHVRLSTTLMSETPRAVVTNHHFQVIGHDPDTVRGLYLRHDSDPGNGKFTSSHQVRVASKITSTTLRPGDEAVHATVNLPFTEMDAYDLMWACMGRAGAAPPQAARDDMRDRVQAWLAADFQPRQYPRRAGLDLLGREVVADVLDPKRELSIPVKVLFYSNNSVAAILVQFNQPEPSTHLLIVQYSLLFWDVGARTALAKQVMARRAANWEANREPPAESEEFRRRRERHTEEMRQWHAQQLAEYKERQAERERRRGEAAQRRREAGPEAPRASYRQQLEERGVPVYETQDDAFDNRQQSLKGVQVTNVREYGEKLRARWSKRNPGETDVWSWERHLPDKIYINCVGDFEEWDNPYVASFNSQSQRDRYLFDLINNKRIQLQVEASNEQEWADTRGADDHDDTPGRSFYGFRKSIPPTGEDDYVRQPWMYYLMCCTEAWKYWDREMQAFIRDLNAKEHRTVLARVYDLISDKHPSFDAGQARIDCAKRWSNRLMKSTQRKTAHDKYLHPYVAKPRDPPEPEPRQPKPRQRQAKPKQRKQKANKKK